MGKWKETETKKGLSGPSASGGGVMSRAMSLGPPGRDRRKGTVTSPCSDLCVRLRRLRVQGRTQVTGDTGKNKGSLY